MTHNIIGSEAYFHPGRDVWAGMLRYVRTNRRRASRLAFAILPSLIGTALFLLAGVAIGQWVLR